MQDRRARTRQVIELGGLVQKAELVELLEDDRATLLGAFRSTRPACMASRSNAEDQTLASSAPTDDPRLNASTSRFGEIESAA